MSTPEDWSLESARADGWLARVGATIGSFDALCGVIGEPFMAFSVLLGVRFTSVAVNQGRPSESMLEFFVGDDPSSGEKVRLDEFRERVAETLIAHRDAPGPLPRGSMTPDALQDAIGAKCLLLAPIFGYRLDRLSHDAGVRTLAFLREGKDDRCTIDAFEGRLNEHIRDAYEALVEPEPSVGPIDVREVQKAEADEQAGNWNAVVSRLGEWPVPLGILLRTPDGARLGEAAKQRLALGLSILATASSELGHTEQSDEVFRIALLYAPEGLVGSSIYVRMATALYRRGRFGECIAPIHRAMEFGASPATTLPLLASAFAKRGKFVAAYATGRRAREAGVDTALLAEVELETLAKFGDSLSAFG